MTRLPFATYDIQSVSEVKTILLFLILLSTCYYSRSILLLVKIVCNKLAMIIIVNFNAEITTLYRNDLLDGG